MQQPDAHNLLADLAGTDHEKIRSAAFTAGDAKLAEAIVPLCHLVANPNIGVQEAAEYALRKIRGPKTVAAMLPLLRSDDAPTRNVAMDVLREIGEDDIASLQASLHDPDPDMRIFIADILGYTKSRQAGLMLCESLLKDPEVNVRYQAAISLGILGFPDAVGALSQAMHDEEWVQFAVVETLAKIRADVTINALVKSLATSSELVCSIIIDALAEMGNVKAVPLLFHSLDTVSEALRYKTVKAIVRILGGKSLSLLSPRDQERFHAHLLKALTSTDEDIQKAALMGLGAMRRESATQTIFDFAQTLPEEDSPMLETALQAIAAIGPTDAFAAELYSIDEARVLLALRAAVYMQDRHSIDLQKDVFWNLSLPLQRMAASRIAQAGTQDDAYFFLNLLEQCTDTEILKYAIYFLGMRFTIAEAEERIFGVLFKPDQELQEAALQACINMQSPVLNQNFRELFHSGEETQRMMAIYALGAYNIEQNLSDLTLALEDESPNVRQITVEAFARQGNVRPYLPLLLPRMNDESRDVRIVMVELLGKTGLPEMTPYLLSALRDADEWVRIRAVEALGELRTQNTVAPLMQMSANASPMLLFNIIKTLTKIGGTEALAALQSLVHHADAEVGQAAADAVNAIRSTQE